MELDEKDRATLLALEETLWRAETRYDPVLMDRTFAPGFIEFGRSGRRYERLDMLLDPDPNAVIDAVLPLPDYLVRAIVPDVALATYTSEVRYGDAMERGRRSSVWRKYAGEWRLEFHQGTPF